MFNAFGRVEEEEEEVVVNDENNYQIQYRSNAFSCEFHARVGMLTEEGEK